MVESDIQIRTLKEVKLESPVFVEGMPGVGLIGGIVASYLIDKLKMEPIAYVDSRFIPPVAVLRNGITRNPVEIYQKDNLLIIFSNVPIVPELVYDLSEKLVLWLISMGVEKMISIAGIPTPITGENVYGVANDIKMIEYLNSNDVDVLTDGMVSGMSGGLMLHAAKRKVPGFTLLAQTPGLNPDPKGSVEIIKVLNKILGLEVDVEPLIREAKEIESKMEELARETRKMKKKEVKELPMFY